MSGREFVIDIIEKYRDLPCLWQITHVDYHNKVKRNSALEELCKLFQTKDPRASKETVSKKINSLRSCFKKEHNKVKTSMKSGAGKEEVHVPKLWYYDYMLFLDDQDMPRRSQSLESILDDMPFGYDTENLEENPTESDDSQNSILPPRPASSFKRPASKADQVLEKIAKRMDERQEQPNKPHDSFGKHVSEKLRNMPQEMVPICEKLISDVLFYGEIGKLNVSSGIKINETFPEGTSAIDPLMIPFDDTVN